MRTTLEKERETYSGAPVFPVEKSSDSAHDAHFFSAALEQNNPYPSAPRPRKQSVAGEPIRAVEIQQRKNPQAPA